MSQYFVYPFAEQGHFTAVHNFVFRRIMPKVSGNAFKVLGLIISETIGYGRKSQGLSYEDIKAGTGIATDTTVANALAELLDDSLFGQPLVLRQDAATRGASRREKTRYALNLKLRLALQKIEGEDGKQTPRTPKTRTPKNGERKKVRTLKNGVCGTLKNGEREAAPIKNARSNQESSKESNILSLCAGEEIFVKNKAIETPPETAPVEPPNSPDSQRPFVEGEADARFESPHFLALASEEVCALDLDILDWKTKSTVGMIAVQLATKYTPEQILEAGRRWELPSKPHPRQLLSRIKALLSEPKTQSQNPDPENSHAIHQRTSAQNARPKYESAAERAGRDLAESFDDLAERRAALDARKRELAARRSAEAELDARDGGRTGFTSGT